MDKSFHFENRKTLYKSLDHNSLAILYSGQAPRKTADEYYPFYANRNFVYMTGILQNDSILLINMQNGESSETLFIPPKDAHAERWSGKHITAEEASDASGAPDIRINKEFINYFDRLILSGEIEKVYLDFDKLISSEADNEAYKLAAYIKERYPFIIIKNLLPLIKKQRTIKKPCEIDAMREAEKATKAGISVMMQSSRPGMYEYEYKAEFDYALAKLGILSPAFPSIISAGKNNFCIHYNTYGGQALDGDFILNDVGACFDNIMTDVSRGFPCNGKFSERQRLLYQCAYDTSEYMFRILKPGMLMEEVDTTIKKYNFEMLKSTGLIDNFNDIGKYMWHGGAHHVGYDVHDVVYAPNTMPLAPGMVFCVDVGIYCEEWGIGFRLEDNCLITENGCENLSASIPRSIEDIEAVMGSGR